MKQLFLLMSLIAIVTSCSNENENSSKLSQNQLTLYSGDTATLTYNGTCKWSSDQPLIASVDNGAVKGLLIGETYIRANNEACKVTVKPNYTMYVEPYIDWESNASEFSKYMYKHGCKEMSSDSSGGLWIDESTNTLYLYLLNNGKISSTCIMTSLYKTENLTKFLCERFIPLGYEDGMAIFINIDRNTGITEMINSDYKDEYALWALAMPYDTRTNSDDIIKKFRQLYTLTIEQ